MTESIIIGATRHMDILHERLCEEFKPLAKEGLRFNLEKNPAGKFTFLACHFFNPEVNRGKKNIRSLYLKNVVNAICEIILNHWKKIILEEIIRETYYYFSAEERDIILSNALEYISGNEMVAKDLLRFKYKRKILNELYEFLNSNNYIIIDGFIRFRLKDYVNDLYEAAEQAVDDFLMEREYREFIQLLKYFVDIQDPRVDCVNVVLESEEVFKLYNEKGELIDSDYMEGFIADFIGGGINYEDLLISSLITIAPNEIIFHFNTDNKHKTAVDMISKIFSGRVRQCEGCSLCKKGDN